MSCSITAGCRGIVINSKKRANVHQDSSFLYLSNNNKYINNEPPPCPSPHFHIDDSLKSVHHEVKYILTILGQSYETEVFFSEINEQAITVSSCTNCDVSVRSENIANAGRLNFAKNFTKDGFLMLENGDKDYLSTAFYLLSLAQELDNTKIDKFGRFPYSGSYQNHFNVVSENRVQHCFQSIITSSSKFSSLKKPNVKTKIFVSHDVDFINGALVQDGFYALKKLNVPAVFQIIFSNLLVNPQWLNMDKIMKIESEYDFKSTFYWLVNKGLSKEGMKNADYTFPSKKVQTQVQLVSDNGWENGLHKSISDDSFDTEIEKLNFTPVGNRYHFLKFRPHNDFELINNVGLKFDTSLGFAEEIGFRNSYGLPYKPFNFKTKTAYDFVECPLHIMDTTLRSYQKQDASEAYAKITSFVEKNSQNAILSLLWHNNYFTPYKFGDYLVLYKKLLSYFKENDLQCITQSQIIEKYS